MDEMNRYLKGLPYSVQEECCMANLFRNMGISSLMVYATKFEESIVKKRNKGEESKKG